MLGQLVLALVEIVVGHLHGLDVEQQFFAGQQAFVSVEVVELNVGQGWSPSSFCRARSAFLATSKASWNALAYRALTSRFIKA